MELGAVVTAIGKNKSLKHLNLGRSLACMKQKHVVVVMEALVQMLQEDDCILQSLSLADSKLKQDISSLINALGSNQCLQSIDIRYVPFPHLSDQLKYLVLLRLFTGALISNCLVLSCMNWTVSFGIFII